MSNRSIDTQVSAALFARESQEHTLHHKIVVFVIVLVLFIARPTLKWSYDTYTSSKKTFEDSVTEHAQKSAQQKTILNELAILSAVKTPLQKNEVVQCYNTNCQTLPEGVRAEPTKTIFKWYLQLQQTTDDKFVVDQKRVLSYLNDFLIKWVNGGNNALIKEIVFGTPKATTLPDLVTIPMTVTITFINKNGLLTFLRNVESFISPVYPMLAKIDSVSYDIVKANLAQDVQIAMSLYMLKGAITDTPTTTPASTTTGATQ